MDIERAKAISDVAQTVINSAKVEVDHMKVAGCTTNSGFITPQETTVVRVPAPPADQGFAGQLVKANVRRHECK